jgi:hypothetical protein
MDHTNRTAYSVHPLPAIGGVFAYVERSGEGIGLYFGRTELEVTAKVANALVADAFEPNPN